MPSERLNILLISPRGDFLSKSEEFRRFMQDSREMRTILHYWNGLGAALPTIAGLTPSQHSVNILDENLEEIDFDVPVDIVGLTAMTQQAARAYEIAAEFQARGVHVAMGGTHASVMPEEASTKMDTVFVGEADVTWPQFLTDFVNGVARNVYRAEDYEKAELTRVPTPRYDLLQRYEYPVVWIQASRGCPHDCDFCSATRIYGRAYRHKEPAQVAAEVREAKRYWKNAQVCFADDNMFVNRRFVSKLLTEFEDIPFTWFAQSDIGIAKHPDLLRRLHETGCRIVFVGLESLDAESLAGVTGDRWKARRVREYGPSVRAIQESGIGVYGSFIVGMDQDDENVFERTVRFVSDHHIMGTQITILTPFPGSRLRDRLESEGRITSNDWRDYTAFNCVIKHPRLTSAQLEDGLVQAYKRIYNPDVFADRAKYFKGVFRTLAGK